MPFKSAKQRKYLYANKPSVAKKFAKHSRKQKGDVTIPTIVVIVIVILLLFWIF